MTARLRLDAALRERIAVEPDALVGVLVRTARVPDAADREALARAGLEVGTVAGDVVTGRLRGCDAVRVAGLEFVLSIEAARQVPRPPMPHPPQDT